MSGRRPGLRRACYGPLLDTLHSPGVDLEKLTRLWTRTAPGALRPAHITADGHPVLLADGIKIPKAGRKMPAVWRGFSSWLPTVRAAVPPSERVVALALRDAQPEFLADPLTDHSLCCPP